MTYETKAGWIKYFAEANKGQNRKDRKGWHKCLLCDHPVNRKYISSSPICTSCRIENGTYHKTGGYPASGRRIKQLDPDVIAAIANIEANKVKKK